MMAKRRAKRMVRKANPSPESNLKCANAEAPQIEVQEDGCNLIDQEVQRQFSAIRAVRDMEIEQLLTVINLLRSFMKKEQLQTNALQFFNENLPNLKVIRKEDNGEFELQWKNNDDDLYKEHGLQASLLHHLSLAYPVCELSSKTVKTSLRDVGNLQIRDFVLEEPFDTQMLGAQDGLQTPGASSQRLSIGMTPKTVRLPKNGEVLLSVHGSPLGVYKEDSMEAIAELEEDQS